MYYIRSILEVNVLLQGVKFKMKVQFLLLWLNKKKGFSLRKLQCIMEELLLTEVEYVRSLAYILTHYLPLLARPDIPPDLRGQRRRIFGNLEKLYDFHCNYFLQELEACRTEPLRVGRCFLRHVCSSDLLPMFCDTASHSFSTEKNYNILCTLYYYNECLLLQRENFGLYALYSKNKPQSDALIQQHAFFKVRNVNKKER